MGVLSDIGRSNALGDATGVLYKNFMQNVAMRDAAGTAGVQNATNLVNLTQQEDANRRAEEEAAMKRSAFASEQAKAARDAQDLPFDVTVDSIYPPDKVPGVNKLMRLRLAADMEDIAGHKVIKRGRLRSGIEKTMADKDFMFNAQSTFLQDLNEAMARTRDEKNALVQKVKAAGQDPTSNMEVMALDAKMKRQGEAYSQGIENLKLSDPTLAKEAFKGAGEGFTLTPGSKRFDAQGNPIADNPKSEDSDRPYKVGQWIDLVKDGKSGKAQVTGYGANGLPIVSDFQPKEGGEGFHTKTLNIPDPTGKMHPGGTEWKLDADGKPVSYIGPAVPPTPFYAPPMTPAQRASETTMMRKEFEGNPIVKQHSEVRSQLAKMEQAIKESATAKTKVAVDQALITIFNKMLDPTSVVRESEYARTSSDQALLNQIKGKWDKIQSGGAGLTDMERNGIISMARRFGSVNDAMYSDHADYYKSIATGSGLNPDHVVKPDKYNAAVRELGGNVPAAPGKSGKKRMVYNPSTGRLE